MGLFSGITKTVGRGLGDVFTLGLAETNLGNGIFKKVGQGVGNVLTLSPNSRGQAPITPPPATSTPMPNTSTDTNKLMEIFKPVQDNAKAQLDANFADQLRKLRSNQAARGVLRSGVADYPVTELMKSNTNALGQTQSALANILGNTEASRSLFGTQAAFADKQAVDDYNRKLQLAQMIADANKKSTLQQIFEGAGALAPFATAALGPGGMAVGALPALSRIFGGGGSGGGSADFTGLL